MEKSQVLPGQQKPESPLDRIRAAMARVRPGDLLAVEAASLTVGAGCTCEECEDIADAIQRVAQAVEDVQDVLTDATGPTDPTEDT